MTKLQELKAAQVAAYDTSAAAWAAVRAASASARADAWAVARAASAASAVAWEAYYDELMKIQKEKQND
jgi:hypothetical protein